MFPRLWKPQKLKEGTLHSSPPLHISMLLVTELSTKKFVLCTSLIPAGKSKQQQDFEVSWIKSFNYPAGPLTLLLASAETDDLCDLLGPLGFLSKPAKMDSFLRFLASLGDMNPLMSTGPEATVGPPKFLCWAADKASRSSMCASILYMATILTSFQIQVKITKKAPMTMQEKSIICMPLLPSSADMFLLSSLTRDNTVILKALLAYSAVQTTFVPVLFPKCSAS